MLQDFVDGSLHFVAISESASVVPAVDRSNCCKAAYARWVLRVRQASS